MRGPLDPFSEVVDERRRWTPEWYSWLSELAPIVSTVAGLPPAAQNAGVRAFVIDGNPPFTFMSTVNGGGSAKAPVYSDGVVWRIG